MILHPRLESLQQRLAPSPLTAIEDSQLSHRRLRLSIKRDDLIHPVLSGNKWRKLKYCLNHVLNAGYSGVISMGGAYSNHLHALAYACQQLGLKSTGLIRGEQTTELNPTLRDLLTWGMELRFVSREHYRQLRDPQSYEGFKFSHPDYFWLPEGGSSQLALQGVAEILDELPDEYHWLALACGTGTTLAGLSSQLSAPRQLLGIAALKNAGFLNQDIARLLAQFPHHPRNWQLLLDYHCGGFAKTTPALIRFINAFEQRHQLALEPVYTGKLLAAVYDLIEQDFFQPGQHIIVLHSGGLQGRRSETFTTSQ